MPIPEVEKIWLNGELVPWHEAKVHVLSHALHYGSGVFEGIRAYKTVKGTAVLRLTDHMRRLAESAKIYYMDLPYTTAELVQATKDLIVANGLEECYIRPLAFRGYGEMGLYPLNAPVDVAIAVWPWGAYLGEEGIRNGVRAKVSSIRGLDHNAISPIAKASGQYLNSILAKIEVTKGGYDEAILLNQNGFVTQGSGENIFFAHHGHLHTPPLSDGTLEGITRDTVMQIAKRIGHAVTEEQVTRQYLYLADEVFYTGTAAEIVPVREIDDHTIGRGEPGPFTREIQRHFRGIHTGTDKLELGHYMEHVR